jgi:hypothetical protein
MRLANQAAAGGALHCVAKSRSVQLAFEPKNYNPNPTFFVSCRNGCVSRQGERWSVGCACLAPDNRASRSREILE